jgi:HEAT repeat protein
MDDLRDYVAEASSILRRGDPMSGLAPQARPLQEIVEQDRKQAIELLRQLLQSGNGTFRKNAAFALGQIGDPSAN